VGRNVALGTKIEPRREQNPAIVQLLANHQLNRAQAAKGAAAFWVRGIEPHNNSTRHRQNTDELAADLAPITNTNPASNREHIETE